MNSRNGTSQIHSHRQSSLKTTLSCARKAIRGTPREVCWTAVRLLAKGPTTHGLLCTDQRNLHKIKSRLLLLFTSTQRLFPPNANRRHRVWTPPPIVRHLIWSARSVEPGVAAVLEHQDGVSGPEGLPERTLIDSRFRFDLTLG
eukprot:m.485745 g.485745  ORF g.485745 m.485745 type:complete len:144 (+) comp75411_c0_seq1:712-1143(+)